MLSNKYKNLESEFLLKIKFEFLSKIIEFLLKINKDFNKLMLSQKITHLTADQMITCKDKA